MTTVPVRIMKQGRITIPEDIREENGLNYGDYVVVDVQPFEGEDHTEG